MKTRWLIIPAAMLLVVVFACKQSSTTPTSKANKAEAAEPIVKARTVKATTKAQIGKPAPDFALKDCFGKKFTLAEFKGKTVVLEWINQQCPISKGAHDKQQMQKTYKKYADKGVIWLAVDSSHFAEPEKNRIYTAMQGLAYPVLHDPDGKVGKAYIAKTTPHMFVIDKTGTLVYNGAIDDRDKTNYVDKALAELLAGKTVSKPKTDSYGCGVKYKK